MGAALKELPFEEWVKTLPDSLRSDPLWKSSYYRLSMYLYDLMWIDTEVINKDFRGREIVHQLVRSAGSVCPIWKNPTAVESVLPILCGS